jgi:hypothetical protein
MTSEQAETVTIGSVVIYQGRRYAVNSIKLGLIAGPHFRLASLGAYPTPNQELTSYRLLELEEEEAR